MFTAVAEAALPVLGNGREESRDESRVPVEVSGALKSPRLGIGACSSVTA